MTARLDTGKPSHALAGGGSIGTTTTALKLGDLFLATLAFGLPCVHHKATLMQSEMGPLGLPIPLSFDFPLSCHVCHPGSHYVRQITSDMFLFSKTAGSSKFSLST